MKVLILSTFEKTGGAAIAAGRLLHALNNNGVDAGMLCRKNISIGPKTLRKQSWSSIFERMAILTANRFTTKDLWATDPALFGQDITTTREFMEADVIHLHWVNQGFLSLSGIRKITESGKRIVWTMHDEWPLESVWHYTDEVMPGNRFAKDVLIKKQQIYSRRNITFVACSEWLACIARSKTLGKGQDIVSVPNPIDTSVFRPAHDKMKAREMLGLPKDKKIVLFVSQNVNDERKGICYFDKAQQLLGNDIITIAPGRDIPYISGTGSMAALYGSADAFVTPSLQDNLPNTIMEAMACGTPCIGFNTGGIPEMIDHKANGYVARYKDAADLAEGIRYVLNENNAARLGNAAREKVERCYSERSVAERYIEIYNRHA
ncbi:MAG: glycosyltransferase [Bacteroidales bacterium]|nr:glycosyltransferase [Bacteroidales bacterium]MCM1148369.1 glycosyltransferase [Bacteroidales bacterium]MCM1207042.1 glycosyltransferase [Bacillota bacterium]MCM1511313.1 glycosyltransferase [Clostridium sp.]